MHLPRTGISAWPKSKTLRSMFVVFFAVSQSSPARGHKPWSAICMQAGSKASLARIFPQRWMKVPFSVWPAFLWADHRRKRCDPNLGRCLGMIPPLTGNGMSDGVRVGRHRARVSLRRWQHGRETWGTGAESNSEQACRAVRPADVLGTHDASILDDGNRTGVLSPWCRAPAFSRLMPALHAVR